MKIENQGVEWDNFSEINISVIKVEYFEIKNWLSLALLNALSLKFLNVVFLVLLKFR